MTVLVHWVGEGISRLFRSQVLTLGLVALTAAATTATTYTVDTLVDENDGIGTGGVSLRDAINAANGNAGADTINFSVTGTITLTNRLPNITESLSIIGPGIDDLTIDGVDTYRAFVIMGGATDVIFQDFSIENCRAKGGNGANALSGGGRGGGGAGMGAAVFMNDGTLRCEDVRFDGNDVIGGDAGISFGAGVGGGGGGGGVGSDAVNSTTTAGTDGGDGGFLGGAAGTGGDPGTAGGAGAGGGGGNGSASSGANGASGGFGGGGAGGGEGAGTGATAGDGGDGGYGGGGGGFGSGDFSGFSGDGGTFGGDGSNSNNAGGGGAGLGGAIFARNGTLTLFNCTFTKNTATGGTGGNDGQGKGGAIFLHPDATGYAQEITWGADTDANRASDDTPALDTDEDDTFGILNGLPFVSSSSRLDDTLNNLATVTYNVTFSTEVTGVDVSDFTLTTTTIGSNPLSGASVQSVATDDSQSYTVTINTGTGDGTIMLNVLDDGTIQNASSTPLGGFGNDNGNATTNAYTIDRTLPAVSDVTVPVTPDQPTKDDAVSIRLEYAEDVTGFTSADVSFATTGTAKVGAVNVSIESETVVVVTALALSGTGTVTLVLVDDAVSDDAGNGSAVNNNVVSFQVDRTAPSVSSITPTKTELVGDKSASFTIKFSEAITGLTEDDFIVTHVGTTHAEITITEEDSTTYTLTLTGLDGTGAFWITLLPGALADTTGNTSILLALSAPVTRVPAPPEQPMNDDNEPETEEEPALEQPWMPWCGGPPVLAMCAFGTALWLTRRERKP